MKKLNSPPFTTEEKNVILRAFVQQFEIETDALMTSAKAAHEAATHEESKAEDSHDTRGIEASYLAGAQAARILKLKEVIHAYRQMIETNLRPMDRVAVGALVGLQLLNEDEEPKGPPILALIASDGGGTSVQHSGKNVSVVSATSPLGELLIGASAGDDLTLESHAGDRQYRVESVS